LLGFLVRPTIVGIDSTYSISFEPYAGRSFFIRKRVWADSSQEWVTSYNIGGPTSSHVNAVIVEDDDAIYAMSPGLALLKFDYSDGTLLEEVLPATVPEAGILSNDISYQDGYLYLCGSRGGNAVLQKWSVSTFSLIWEYAHASPLGPFAYPYWGGLVTDSDSAYVVGKEVNTFPV
jgi:hypothetical protein